jgi:predicted O-methyltransferase YrrM
LGALLGGDSQQIRPAFIRRFCKALLLLQRAVDRPHEALETAQALGGNFLGPSSKFTPYEAIDWQAALPQLQRRLGIGFSRTVERGLHEVENEVATGLRAITTRAPWGLEFDIDPSLASCLYIVCRTLRPALVVETGVAYGVSSAFLLKALDANRQGRLESIDLPPLALRAEEHIGIVVPDYLKYRWRLHRGSSRRLLGAIVRDTIVDLFIHDSDHSYSNMRREFQTVWSSIRSGGVLVADDVGGNGAFDELRLNREVAFSLVVRGDVKRESMFGIAVKR